MHPEISVLTTAIEKQVKYQAMFTSDSEVRDGTV